MGTWTDFQLEYRRSGQGRVAHLAWRRVVRYGNRVPISSWLNPVTLCNRVASAPTTDEGKCCTTCQRHLVDIYATLDELSGGSSNGTK